MDNDGNKVVWTVVIISAIAIIGLMFVNFMPSQTANIKTAIGNELSSFGNSTKSDSSNTNTTVGTNLFSQSTATSGYVNGSTGNINATSPSNEIVSDYIPVSANSNYTFQMWGTTPSNHANWYGIGLYDSDKKFISRQAEFGSTQTSDTAEHVSKNLTTTSATAYVRVSFSKYNDYKVKLEKGSVATPYTP